jgi:hypothetical protein
MGSLQMGMFKNALSRGSLTSVHGVYTIEFIGPACTQWLMWLFFIHVSQPTLTILMARVYMCRFQFDTARDLVVYLCLQAARARLVFNLMSMCCLVG